MKHESKLDSKLAEVKCAVKSRISRSQSSSAIAFVHPAHPVIGTKQQEYRCIIRAWRLQNSSAAALRRRQSQAFDRQSRSLPRKSCFGHLVFFETVVLVAFRPRRSAASTALLLRSLLPAHVSGTSYVKSHFTAKSAEAVKRC